MNKLFKTGILSTAALCMALAPVSEAFARDRYHPGWGGRSGWSDRYNHYDRWNDRHYKKKRDNKNDAIVAGVVGLAAGALLGTLLTQSSQQSNRTYRAPSNQTYYYPSAQQSYYPAAPQAYQSSSYQPWSQQWYQHCANKYRSFNPQDGTYRGYDGRSYFCNAR